MADILFEVLATIGKSILDLSALVLSIINGIMLLRIYLRDRPRLIVKPVYPDVYQWFSVLPPRKYQGQDVRRYGYLAYVSVTNKGLRDVSLESWYLHVKTKRGKPLELGAVSIQEPVVEFPEAGMSKTYPVLGVKGLHYEGDTMVRSGSGIAGFSYHEAEFFGGEGENPLVESNKTTGKIVVRSVLGDEASTEIVFREIAIEKLRQMIPGIDKITLSDTLFP